MPKTQMDKVCERYDIKLEYVSGPHHDVDDEGWEHHRSRVRLSYHTLHGGDYRSLETVFTMGMGIQPDDLSPADVLSSWRSDYEAGSFSFAEFCDEFGYDQDSRKAHATWEKANAFAPKFVAFCDGNDVPLLRQVMNAEH